MPIWLIMTFVILFLFFSYSGSLASPGSSGIHLRLVYGSSMILWAGMSLMTVALLTVVLSTHVADIARKK